MLASARGLSRSAMMRVPRSAWVRQLSTSPRAMGTAKQMAEWLLRIAFRIDWRSYRKSPRGPKKKKEVGRYPRASPHEATARVLAERSKKRKNAP